MKKNTFRFILITTPNLAFSEVDYDYRTPFHSADKDCVGVLSAVRDALFSCNNIDTLKLKASVSRDTSLADLTSEMSSLEGKFVLKYNRSRQLYNHIERKIWTRVMNKIQMFRSKLDNFFGWVKVTELVELDDIDIDEDPVRPELSVEWRKEYGRKIFGLKYKDEIEGIICIAYTNDTPESVKELDLMSQNAHYKGDANTAVAYTVWSRKRGAGKEIICKIRDLMKTEKNINRLVTLSPLTPMATHFHVRNGAKQIAISSTTQNFEYDLT